MKKGKNPVKSAIIFLFILFAVIGLIHLAWILIYSKSVLLKKVDIVSPKISAELEGYRILLLADTHDATGEDVKKMFDENNLTEIDLILLAGDLGPNRKMKEQLEYLSTFSAADGVFAVGGNHDNHLVLSEVCDQHGFHMLKNEGSMVRPGLYVGGVEDLWLGQPDVAKAMELATPQSFNLLMSHNPDISMQQSMDNVDYVVSGHTHGGHVSFFGKWAPALSRVTDYGNQFKGGLAYGNSGVPVYVSKGSGWYNAIPRVFARPEITVFTLCSEG